MDANVVPPCIRRENCHYVYTKVKLSYTPGSFSFYNVLQPGFIWTMPGNVSFSPHRLRRIISLGSIKFEPLRGHSALFTVCIALPAIYEATKMQNHHGNQRAAGKPDSWSHDLPTDHNEMNCSCAHDMELSVDLCKRNAVCTIIYIYIYWFIVRCFIMVI